MFSTLVLELQERLSREVEWIRRRAKSNLFLCVLCVSAVNPSFPRALRG
jgi:hypothetical protein